MKYILTIEDEPDMTDLLASRLRKEGLEIMIASSGKEALGKIGTGSSPDLVLLDTMLPDMSGLEVCRRLRTMKKRPFPILMLSARQQLADKIAGLDSGADDYITKPFDFDELAARIRTSLRRAEEITRGARTIEIGDLLINTSARQVWRAGERIELTKREYDLLVLLARNAGHVLTKGCIFEHVWGSDSEAGWEGIKVYVNSLRSKLNASGKPNMISCIRGIGYVLRP
ncbi:MAG TPA: response regulator transcription factor [Ktedonobacteraceae bacterium]|nr:response regulator transcription factor [Ktedonobacteraceae bacterium]